MSKNKKVIIASLGVVLALVLAVLLIRSPGKEKIAPEPPPKQVVTSTPQQTKPPKDMDDSHQKVADLIDSTSAKVAEKAPGVWTKVTDCWHWVMGFDTKHAVIFLAVLIIVFGVIATGGKSKRKQH